MVDLSKIREIARQGGMTLTEVAEKSGCTPQTLSRIMRTNATDVKTLDLIAQALDVSPAVFFVPEPSKVEQVINPTPKKKESHTAEENGLIRLLMKQNEVLENNNALLREYLEKLQ